MTNRLTTIFVNDIKRAQWFTALPVLDCGSEPYSCHHVTTISLARKHANTQKWFTATSRVGNWLCDIVRERDRSAFQQWNNHVSPLTQALDPIVEEKFGKAGEADKELLIGAKACVTYVALQYCFFSEELMPWLTWLGRLMVRGYLPCGWHSRLGDSPTESGGIVFYSPKT